MEGWELPCAVIFLLPVYQIVRSDALFVHYKALHSQEIRCFL